MIRAITCIADGTFGFQGWKSLSNPDVFMLDDAGSGQMTFERIWQLSRIDAEP